MLHGIPFQCKQVACHKSPAKVRHSPPNDRPAKTGPVKDRTLPAACNPHVLAVQRADGRTLMLTQTPHHVLCNRISTTEARQLPHDIYTSDLNRVQSLSRPRCPVTSGSGLIAGARPHCILNSLVRSKPTHFDVPCVQSLLYCRNLLKKPAATDPRYHGVLIRSSIIQPEVPSTASRRV